MRRIFLALLSGPRCPHSKAAVNTPQSRRSAFAMWLEAARSVRTAVASAPLLARANFTRSAVCLAMCVLWLPAKAAEADSSNDAEAAYTRTITQRAEKIVAALDIADTNKATRLRDIIARQYRDLSVIHDARDAQIKAAREKAGTDQVAASTAIESVQAETRHKLDQLHPAFLKRLSGELTSEQVDQVKDGLTFGVLPLTYGVYLKMYPELTDEQKAQIKAWLTEARELAMDGSTADEKHAVFGKYKGKINNYLSKAGYDAKKGEQNLKKSAAPPPPKLN